MLNQSYYGHGKLLLSGEYFVLDGAEALALPTTVGQSMSVTYTKSYNPKLKWTSVDPSGKNWFDAEFEFWKFDCNRGEGDLKVEILRKILSQARKQNPHFLRDGYDVKVETKLEFPINWGLGSSSSLLYNIAQWAYVSPFELQSQTVGGSGYDIACAQSSGPILYKRDENTPSWEQVEFNPEFKEQLFFIYLGNKQNTQDGIELYKKRGNPSFDIIETISDITRKMFKCDCLDEFEQLIADHEDIVSDHLKLSKVKDRLFSEFWGQVKSLGAWGGDFALVTSNRDIQETREYFYSKGIDTFIAFNEIIRKPLAQ
jgi:mevalonate kinase